MQENAREGDLELGTLKWGKEDPEEEEIIND
jgi:hypothetical protein